MYSKCEFYCNHIEIFYVFKRFSVPKEVKQLLLFNDQNGRSLDIGYRLQPSWGGCLVAARACAAHLFTEQPSASAQ